MKKDPQAADDQVEQVVQELHICNHSFVTTSEGSTVPDKAHEEDDLITELKNNEKRHSEPAVAWCERCKMFEQKTGFDT